MKVHLKSTLSVTLAILLGTACMVEYDELGAEYHELGAERGCPTDQCCSNTPALTNYGVPSHNEPPADIPGVVYDPEAWSKELSRCSPKECCAPMITVYMTSERYQDGFRYLYKDGLEYELDIRGGEIIGRAHHRPGLEGSDLIGAEITGESILPKGHRLIISGLESKTDWSLEKRDVPLYRVTMKGPPMPLSPPLEQDICDSQPAALVRGFIDPSVRSFSRTHSNSHKWFTLACPGTAPYNMIMMHYVTDDAASGGYETTDAQRTATLRMITASYCPVPNTTFTSHGIPYVPKNRQDWLGYSPPDGFEVEAVWAESGALCLNQPRDVKRQFVVNTCGDIPRCNDERKPGQTWFEHYVQSEQYEWITYIAPPIREEVTIAGASVFMFEEPGTVSEPDRDLQPARSACQSE